jgi:AcrR family transcriptional regulator
MTPMPQNKTPRQRARAQTLEDITRIGRRHLATEGAAALSVRAIARDLGIVSSAIYRYVRSRDDLLTLLLVDGYNEVGDAVDEAAGAVAADDYRGRFLAIGRAVRTWALREPATYALLFGSPVPGYRAPSDQTTGPGTRVITALVRLWEDAHQAGAVQIPDSPGLMSPTLSADIERIRAEFSVGTPDDLVARGVLAWAALFGCVSFEVFGQYGPGTFTGVDDLFELQLQLLADTTGLTTAG